MPDPVKPSRMELRLDAEIAAATSPLEADCKRAERAAYLARLGRFEEAKRELAVLHGRYELAPQVRVSIWLNLAEGLLIYFGNVGVGRSDKVLRAHALSVSANVHPLRALCAAWLAQWAYVRLDMDALAVNVRESLQIAEPDNHAARSRASLVLAQGLHLAGRYDLASAWYRLSRHHAVADSDDATISALMHNMAWLRMLSMRQLVLAGSGSVDAGRHALMNAESTINFDDRVGDSSWRELKPVLRAQIVSLMGDAPQALKLYQEHFDETKAATRLQANLLADKAWCHTQLGQLDEARDCVGRAEACLNSDIDTDDLAAAHSRLSHSFEALGDPSNRDRHLAKAESAWASHALIQAKAIALLGSVDRHGNLGKV